MDASSTMALENHYSAIARSQAHVKGRRAPRTAPDGRHRPAAKPFASRPSALCVVAAKLVQRNAASECDAGGGRDEYDHPQRKTGEPDKSRDGERRNRPDRCSTTR